METSKFIRRSLLFITLNMLLLILSLLLIHLNESRFNFHNWETESSLLVTPENEKFDLMILGSSHGRIFSRDKNHLRVEQILNKKIINLAKGGGNGGVTPNYLFFNWFYQQGNDAKQIVYFIDPWAFNSPKWNEESYFLADEPVNLSFLWLCIKEGVAGKVILNYFKSKYTVFWLRHKPYSEEINNKALPGISEEALKKRKESLYIEPFKQKVFDKYAAQLEEMVRTAKAKNAEMIFIFPSILLDDNSNKDKVLALLRRFKKDFGVSYYDYSGEIKDYHLYYDHDHLNTKGIVLFTEKYLKPLVFKEK